jgi:hypothetical protein
MGEIMTRKKGVANGMSGKTQTASSEGERELIALVLNATMATERLGNDVRNQVWNKMLALDVPIAESIATRTDWVDANRNQIPYQCLIGDSVAIFDTADDIFDLATLVHESAREHADVAHSEAVIAYAALLRGDAWLVESVAESLIVVCHTRTSVGDRTRHYAKNRSFKAISYAQSEYEAAMNMLKQRVVY